MLKTIRVILKPLYYQKLWLLRKAEAIPKEFRPVYDRSKYPDGCARIINNAIQKMWQTCRATKQIPVDKQISKIVRKNGVLYLKIQKELIPFRVKTVDKLDDLLLNHYNSAVVWLKGEKWVADVQVEVESKYQEGKPEAVIGIDLGKWHNAYSIWISQLTSKFFNMADCSQTNQPSASTLNFSQSSKHIASEDCGRVECEYALNRSITHGVEQNILEDDKVIKFVEVYRAFDKFGKYHFTMRKITKKIAEVQRNFEGTRKQLSIALKPLYEKRRMVLRQYYGTLRNKILQHIPQGYNAVFVLEDLDSLPRAELRKMQRTWAMQELANGIFASQLEWNGYKVVKVDARGTTHTCSRCGAKWKGEPNDRKMHCKNCGLTLDRDLNGARNIARRYMLSSIGELTCTPNVRLSLKSYMLNKDNREIMKNMSENNEPNKFG